MVNQFKCGDINEGWMLCKCGRGSRIKVGIGDCAETMVDKMVGHGNLNLNLSSKKLDTIDGMHGRGRNSATNSRGTGSRGEAGNYDEAHAV